MDFEEWQESAESYKTLQVGRDRIRDCYIFPNGIHCYEDFVSPYSIYNPSYSVVTVDYTVPKTTTIPGASINDDWYTEEGYGLPEFKGEDPMKAAFEYAMSLKLKKVGV
jgi:hypothetical protein